MNRSVLIPDQDSADSPSPFGAIELASFLFAARPQCEEFLTFVDSCRRQTSPASLTVPSTAPGDQWRRKCEAGELTEEELRTGLCGALDGVIHTFLSAFRPGYRFAVRVSPERLWSAIGPKVQVESFGPEVDHSIMEDLRLLMSLSQQMSIEPFGVEDAS